jgi:Rha family phage regulatory protein
MTLLTTHTTVPEVTIHNGKAVTTSLAIAEYFHKRHDDVLKKIRSVIDDCEPEYHARNFAVCHKNSELQNGKPLPYFELTRDAFVLIVMGFTGKKALQWKIDYINAFNKMEETLSGTAQVASIASQEEIDAYNVQALVKHYRVFYDTWKNQIEPALRTIESPLAGRLHDRFKDGAIFLMYVEKSLNAKLNPGQAPRLH